MFLVFISAYGLGVNLIKGNFILQDLNRGRACLLGNIPDYSVEVQYTKKAITYALIASAFIRLVYFKFKVKRFITGLCPNGKMSCLGNFKRNVISLNQTFWWFMWWCFSSTLCCISPDYGKDYFSDKTQFCIWNLSGFIGYEGLLLCLPFLLDIPSQGTVSETNAEFYVRKPVLEPRIWHIPCEIANKSVSCFGYANQTECTPAYSQTHASARNFLLVHKLPKPGKGSDKPETSGQFHMMSGIDLGVGEILPSTSRMVMGLPDVE